MTVVFEQVRRRRDHRWAPGRMSAYIDGELASRGRARMERHTEECPECRGVLHSLRRMVALLQRVPAPRADATAIAAAVRRRLHEPPAT